MTQDRQAPARRVEVPTRIVCVDDSHDITEVMRMIIATDPRLECVGCLASAHRLIDEMRGMSRPPHVVLLDASMPGPSPLDVMRHMASELPAIRVIVFSGHTDSAFIDRVRDAGAWGYVSKSDEPDRILRAVHEVAAGNAWWPPPPSLA